MNDAANEARAHGVLARLDDGKLQMGERRLQSRNGHDLGRCKRPIAATGQAAGEDARVVGEVCDREWRSAQVFEGGRGMKRRQHPVRALRDQPERRDVWFRERPDRRDDGFADHRHRITSPTASP